ncbi:MAG: nitrilase-related carbon-nitrogen hydrolase [Ignavibacteria bacterium]
MKIAIVQSFPTYADTQQNVTSILTKIESIKADMIVFPELATSGYFFTDKNSLFPHALTWNESPELLSFQALSSEHNVIIIIGFPEKDGDVMYNSAGIFMPHQEDSRVYRKTHLFYKEHEVFAEGNSGFFCVHDAKTDCTIGIMICYDWRFPEAARTLALQGADLIACPANLVTTLSGKVFPARAIENKVYVAVANRIGEECLGEETLLFRGESAIYDYVGERMAQASFGNEEILYAEIDPQSTRKKSFNSVNDIFKDRRPDMYS